MSEQINTPRAQTAPGWRRTALWVVTILVALVFLAAGLAKLAGVQMLTNIFDSPTYSNAFSKPSMRRNL